jgi:hypothetical protein
MSGRTVLATIPNVARQYIASGSWLYRMAWVVELAGAVKLDRPVVRPHRDLGNVAEGRR